MRMSVAQLAAFVLSLPSWILALGYFLYPVSFHDGGLPVFAIIIACSICLGMATTLSFCSEDFSGWRIRFLLSWEICPVLFAVILCLAWVVKNWSDISDWVFLALMSCVDKMIFGFGHR
jgi:hypothetical protein